jgi:hypothetical protein
MRPNCLKEGMEWCNKLFVTGVGPTVSVKRSVSIVEPILAHTCEVFFNPPSRDTYCGQTFIFIVQERINSRFLQALELHKYLSSSECIESSRAGEASENFPQP